MLKINYYELGSIDNDKLQFAVIMAKYKNKWIFVRHKDRTTWEIPGGHREENEIINFTASRELTEETGAIKFTIAPVCIYSVTTDKGESFGQLFYADVECLGELPELEIAEIKLFNCMPENLTYPMIQPYLFKKVEDFLNN